MDRPDDVVPGMARHQLPNPILLSRNKIHFKGQFDAEGGVVTAGLLHIFHIRVQIGLKHVPIVPIIARHRIMLGEADFRKTQLDRVRRQIGWVTHRMAA